jgi:DNA-binding CsgD family transcriptional regulator
MTFNRGEVSQRLQSRLYRSLVTAAEMLLRAVEADLAAGRIFRPPRALPTSYVTTPTPRVSTQHVRALADWPDQRGGLFNRLAVRRPLPDGVFRCETVLGPSALDEQGEDGMFGPVASVAEVDDVLCLNLPMSGRSWALLTVMRCNDGGSFSNGEHNRLMQHHGDLKQVLCDGHSWDGVHEACGPGGGQSVDEVVERLSDTEQRVLNYLRQGYTERQAAEEMDRSRHTVHVHVKNIYRKFGVFSRRELLATVK